jgi:hypothetical protein
MRDAEREPEICGDTKPGPVDVTCAKKPGHVKAGDEWHMGAVTTEDQRVITGEYARHTYTSTAVERVEWIDPMTRLTKRLDSLKKED